MFQPHSVDSGWFMGRIRSRRPAGIVLFILVFLGSAGAGRAQHYVELRGADTKYRFVDWNYTFPNAAIVDLFYVGVPGNNEINIGGGYGFRIRPWLTVAPLVYATVAKEDGERGIKAALLVTLDKDGWKLNSFFGHFAPLSGAVGRYQVLDTLDFSRAFGRGWELGISNGLFHSGGKWNPQSGPLLKRSDRLGAWAVSYRFGPQRELRVTRTFVKTAAPTN